MGGRGGATGARKLPEARAEATRGEGEGEDDGGEGADRRTNDAVAACLTAGDDDGVRATYDEASDGGREAATGGGDAGDDGGGDDDDDDGGGETRGGNGGDDGGEASGGSGAATGDGVDSEGGPAKRQRGERGGRKTGNHKDITRRASASRGPVNVGASGLALSAGLSEDHGAPRDFDMWATRSLLAVEGHSRSLFQRARAPHARVIRRASQGPQGRDGRVVLPCSGVHGKARASATYCSQQRRPGRVPLGL